MAQDSVGGKQTLKAAVVKGMKPLIEQKIDRTIVNVDAMITATGSNALEALSKSPGVMIDVNDNISLNGKSNVLVLIDNRPTYMSGQELAAYLRTLPAGTIDKLELIPNPPAQYDAAGGAVINIVLKKIHAAGFNGGINLGYNQGVYGRANEAVNFNYRLAKSNLFGNAGYGLDRNYSDQTFSRYFYNAAGGLDAAAFQNSGYHYRSDGWNGRVGMDLFTSPQTTLGFMVSGSTRPKTDLLTYRNMEYDGAGALDSSGRGTTSGRYVWRNIGINGNAAHTFKASGARLTADLDYVRFHAENYQHAPLSVVLPDGSLSSSEDRVFEYPGDTYIYSAKADLTRPLGGTAEFDAGMKFSYVFSDNRFDWFVVSGNKQTQDYSRSNDFRYKENINAAYVNYKRQWARWGIQAGVRTENTYSAGHQLANLVVPDSSFSRSYTNVFPSAFVSYKLDSAGRNTLVLSYTRKIRRPGYQQLNPFLFYQDQYSYSAGNPGLQPYCDNYFELKYAYKQYFGVTAGFWYNANGVQGLTQAYGEVFVSRPRNYILSRCFSLIPYVALRPARWWDLHFNAVLIYILNNGTAGGGTGAAGSVTGAAGGAAGSVTVDQRTNVHEFETSNEFRISESWSAELDGFFPGKQTFGQTQSNRAPVNISGGVRKSILGDRGILSLNFNDIFHSFYKMATQTIDIAQVTAYSTKETDTRRIGIGFSYRFGKAANARKVRHDSGGAEDEQARSK